MYILGAVVVLLNITEDREHVLPASLSGPKMSKRTTLTLFLLQRDDSSNLLRILAQHDPKICKGRPCLHVPDSSSGSRLPCSSQSDRVYRSDRSTHDITNHRPKPSLYLDHVSIQSHLLTTTTKMTKRPLDTFFKPIPPPTTKRTKPSTSSPSSPSQQPDTHPSYPTPIAKLPSHLTTNLLHGTPARPPKPITTHPNLDLLYFQPYIARPIANELFKFLRAELPFYRVAYKIRRGGVETQIHTPRYTTVFGVDETARFIPHSELDTTQSQSQSPSNAETSTSTPSSSPESQPVPIQTLHLTTLTPAPNTDTNTKYKHTPRPLPTSLTTLLHQIEAATGARYNFCLVNYYASGEDSIAFHSDDERFLGPEPTIASLSLGGEREFVMKHKPVTDTNTSSSSSTASATGGTGNPQIKMPLGSGDMVVMRGPTQANWLHSIPKRRGKSGENVRGRINITFRRAVVPGGTENYYRYNVGDGGVYRWDGRREEMVLQEDGRGGDAILPSSG